MTLFSNEFPTWHVPNIKHTSVELNVGQITGTKKTNRQSLGCKIYLMSKSTHKHLTIYTTFNE